MKTSFRVIPAENGFLILEGDPFSARDGSYGRQWVATNAAEAGRLLGSLLAGEGVVSGEAHLMQRPARGPVARNDYGVVGSVGREVAKAELVASRDAQNLANMLQPGP